MMNRQQMLELLRKDVVPALGCTEPGCAALCAAYAGKGMEAEPESILMEVNAGIYKNGMSAGIPNCSRTQQYSGYPSMPVAYDPAEKR